MDIQRHPTQWAKSTENRIEMFLDSYLIRSPIASVRASSQRLILSLFKKGNQEQKQKIMTLIEARCDELTWMGKASQDYLTLIKNIFSSTQAYAEQKRNIIRKIFANLQKIHKNLTSNSQYQFYSFASNLIDFGNEQFKPYLLQANGCLKCFGCNQAKSQNFKFDTCVQTTKIFSNKLQYIFKRVYDVKQLSINLKTNGRMRGVTVYYLDTNKQYKKLSNNKFKPGQAISASAITLQGLMLQFDLVYSGAKKRVQCIFCDVVDQLNGVCTGCSRRSDVIDISGTFKVVGADQGIISDQLCQDYQKIQDNVTAIKNLHNKMESKQKISLNFKLDQMMEVYQRIINNLALLHHKNSSNIKAKQDQNCFSCNYYEILNIVNFLKETMKKLNNVPLQEQQINNFKQILRNCLETSKMQFLKVNLLQTLSVFIVYSGKANYNKQFQSTKIKFRADLISNVLVALKQRRNSNQTPIQDELLQIRTFLQQKHRQLRIDQKIQIFTCYFLDWEYLSLVLSNSVNHSTQINRLTNEQFSEFSSIIDFDLAEVFNLSLNGYLKMFLKIIPSNVVPAASLDIADCQFLQYVDNKIPEIDKNKIQESIICNPYPMIKLDMFASLPVLIAQLPVKQSMKVMNSLFPYRNVWNLNLIKSCKKFDSKLSELPTQQQIQTCLQGFSSTKQNLYIQKIYKLLVPQRQQFIIRLQAPISEIQIQNVQYPYLSNRQVKSQDLHGDTIKSLHQWVVQQLAKMNIMMPLDIIVQKNIIDNMELPIQLVYQNISENKSKRKIGDKEYQFFRVIYRVQGLLGEPKQRSIGNLRDQKLETCISNASYFLNKFSQQHKQKIGLDVLIQILQELTPGRQSQSKKMLLFEILSTLSMNQAINKKIVQGQYGDSIINSAVRLMSFQNEKDAKMTHFLLQLSSKVIDQANKQMINLRKGSIGEYRKMSGLEAESSTGGLSDSEKKVKFVLEKIAECDSTFEKSGNVLYRQISRRLTKLLPFCSKDETQPSQILFNYFEFSNWTSKSSSKLQNLLIFMDSLSESYMTFKCLSGEKGVTNEILKAITNSIRKQGKDQIDEKKLSVNKLQTQSALLILCALVQGDENLQGVLFENKIFQNIYDISQIPPKKAVQIGAGRVPENCYKIIKYLTEGKIVDHRITQFLNQKKRTEKSNVQPKKNKKWEMMKNKQKEVLSKTMVNQAQEKDLIICSSCQEGYSKKKQILGIYIYLTKNEIPMQVNWWKDSRRFPSFTSTTYLTPIHLECHNRAYEADQKIARSQWDGALIRNMDVLCNSWMPFKGPKTTVQQFARVQRKYFQRNKNGNYWNVVNDLSNLIEKLSIEFDFATESKGSNSSHNCRYLPILIGFACHMIQRAGGCPNIEEGLTFLMENPPKKLAVICNMVCYSIFVMNYDWFNKNKEYFHEWILNHRIPELTDAKNFQALKPHLLFLKIVQQIFELLHKHIKPQNTEANQSTKFYKLLDQHIMTHLQDLIPEFDRLNQRYKSKYTKFTTIAEFQF